MLTQPPRGFEIKEGVAGHTHHDQLFGVPATGRPLRISGFSIFRIVDGKIVEHWKLLDRLDLMQQLGAIPAPPPPAGSAI